MNDETGSRLIPGITRTHVLIIVCVVVAVFVAAVMLMLARSRRVEVDRLAGLLSLHDGMTVAEIGAGGGWLTVEIGRHIGSSGRIYSTELSADRLDDIRQAVADAGLANVTVLQAGEAATNLPSACCEAIYMRRVYHHLADSAAILASIRNALKPGGRLVIIEFRSRGLLGIVTRMGIERANLMDEVGAAGFKVVTTDDWPGWDHYVAVFEKLDS